MNFLKLTKEWEDDDTMLKVELAASNGLLTTTQDFYAYPEDIEKFGTELAEYFPKNGEGNVLFEYGSETKKYHSFVKLDVRYISPGAIGILIQTNNKKEGFAVATAKFTIETTLQSVNDLGKRIINWSFANEKPLIFELQNA